MAQGSASAEDCEDQMERLIEANDSILERVVCLLLLRLKIYRKSISIGYMWQSFLCNTHIIPIYFLSTRGHLALGMVNAMNLQAAYRGTEFCW